MKDVIELANQAGLCLANDEKPLIERFAALVRNAALEEAAQKCDGFAQKSQYKTQRSLAEWCASSVRNLKEPTP